MPTSTNKEIEIVSVPQFLVSFIAVFSLCDTEFECERKVHILEVHLIDFYLWKWWIENVEAIQSNMHQTAHNKYYVDNLQSMLQNPVHSEILHELVYNLYATTQPMTMSWFSVLTTKLSN